MEEIEVLTKIEVIIPVDLRGKKTRALAVGTRLYGKIRPDGVWCLGTEPSPYNLLNHEVEVFPDQNHPGWNFTSRPYLQSDFEIVIPAQENRKSRRNTI